MIENRVWWLSIIVNVGGGVLEDSLYLGIFSELTGAVQCWQLIGNWQYFRKHDPNGYFSMMSTVVKLCQRTNTLDFLAFCISNELSILDPVNDSVSRKDSVNQKQIWYFHLDSTNRNIHDANNHLLCLLYLLCAFSNDSFGSILARFEVIRSD